MSVLLQSPSAPILRKRKSVEDESIYEHVAFPRAIKQLRRLESYQTDNDHAMSLPSFESNPAFSASPAAAAPSSPPSPAGSASSPPCEYPLIQLYPELPDANAMDVDMMDSPPETPTEQVGVLGLSSFGEQHKSCTQLPRLQVANYPGLEGHRAMFSRCMQCGGISQLPNL